MSPQERASASSLKASVAEHVLPLPPDDWPVHKSASETLVFRSPTPTSHPPIQLYSPTLLNGKSDFSATPKGSTHSVSKISRISTLRLLYKLLKNAAIPVTADMLLLCVDLYDRTFSSETLQAILTLHEAKTPSSIKGAYKLASADRDLLALCIYASFHTLHYWDPTEATRAQLGTLIRFLYFRKSPSFPLRTEPPLSDDEYEGFVKLKTKLFSHHYLQLLASLDFELWRESILNRIPCKTDPGFKRYLLKLLEERPVQELLLDDIWQTYYMIARHGEPPVLLWNMVESKPEPIDLET